jgi:hypothetical protein
VDHDGGIHEQAPSIGKSLDEIFSLGFVSLSNGQIEDLRCPEDTTAQRLLRGHHLLPLMHPVNDSGQPVTS